MAQVVKLVDDLDQSDVDVQAVRFALAGKAYEIDLSAANRAKLQEALAPYIAAARTPGTAGVVAAKPAKDAKERWYELLQLREFAGSNGFKVPTARPEKALLEAYAKSIGYSGPI